MYSAVDFGEHCGSILSPSISSSNPEVEFSMAEHLLQMETRLQAGQKALKSDLKQLK